VTSTRTTRSARGGLHLGRGCRSSRRGVPHAGENYGSMIARSLACLLVLAAAGCASVPGGRDWGADATLKPGWHRVRQAAVDAARDPWVWAPIAGAAVLQIDDWDGRISDWAREHTPVFGSTRNAQTWSDDLRTAAVISYHLTALAAPSGDTPSEWLLNKARGYAVGLSAAAITVAATTNLKRSTDRTRPNGADTESFPSGHTSTAAVHTQLASRNLDWMDLQPGTRRALDIGLHALVVGTSWARIEAGWHYPADTLVGAALGRFMASFFNDAFLGTDAQTGGVPVVNVLPDGAEIGWRWYF
jgi:membrane-associated phospholipid phosphatase